MKLVSVTVHGYRRLATKSTMILDGKLVAIVGPNEAGKTSFLNALVQLNEDAPALRKFGPSQDLSRGFPSPADAHALVEARFALDQGDLDAVGDIPEGKHVRWLTLLRRVNGKRAHALEPLPRRDTHPRAAAAALLTRLLGSSWLDDLELDDAPGGTLFDHLEPAQAALLSGSETLSTQALGDLQRLAVSLEPLAPEGPVLVAKLLKSLADLLVREQLEPPASRIAKVLLARVPRFALFDQDERDLASEYDLEKAAADTPAALLNLASLAHLSLQDLQSALKADDSGLVESLVAGANSRLRETFAEAWSQSDIAVRLRADAGRLQILVGSHRSSAFDSIAERSDGLRQFVALLAFSRKESSGRPVVLLIDEAESHLHYDAQADLVQMLSRQTLVDKVIYTTHSMGCLPEDLGTGVRFIEAVDDAEQTHKHSKVRNWFWTEHRPGFDPLLFGMGATTLAFVPVRYALVAEGITEVILLPTLMREATGLKSLGFQIVPGLSEAGARQFPLIERAAPRVAYLVDSDAGGKALERKLAEANVSADRIVRLGRGLRTAKSLEDFVAADLYIAAVNDVVRRWNGDRFAIGVEQLPGDGSRASAVAGLCKDAGVPPPSKREVAYRVLELALDSQRQILDHGREKAIKQAHASVLAALQLGKPTEPRLS